VLSLRSLVLFNKAIEHDNCPIVYRLHDTKANDASWQVALFFVIARSGRSGSVANFKFVRCAMRDGLYRCRFSFRRRLFKGLVRLTPSSRTSDMPPDLTIRNEL
jgi:hypothetical protein